MASVIGLLNPSKNSIDGDQLLAYYINSAGPFELRFEAIVFA
jgi:hypothetical protein